MKKITVKEQYELFKATLDYCGTYLLDCNDDDVEYNIFEEFDGDSISYLSELVLNSLLSAKYISEEIRSMALKLANDFRQLDGTILWNVKAVRSSQEWLAVLSLADEIKKKLKSFEASKRKS